MTFDSLCQNARMSMLRTTMKPCDASTSTRYHPVGRVILMFLMIICSTINGYRPIPLPRKLDPTRRLIDPYYHQGRMFQHWNPPKQPKCCDAFSSVSSTRLYGVIFRGKGIPYVDTFEEQRLQDLEIMRASYQQLYDSDYATIQSLQDLAQFVSFQGNVQ